MRFTAKVLPYVWSTVLAAIEPFGRSTAGWSACNPSSPFSLSTYVVVEKVMHVFEGFKHGHLLSMQDEVSALVAPFLSAREKLRD